MARNTFTILGIFAILVMSLGAVSAASLAEWNLNVNGVATNVDTNINAGTFISSGVNFISFNTNGASAKNWSLVNSTNTSKYFEVTLSPNTGYDLTISDIGFNYSASTSVNLANFELQYSTQSSFGSPTSIVIKTDVNQTDKTSSNSGLNIQVDEGKTLTLRWFGYNFSADTNQFRVESLTVDGTTTAVVIPPTPTPYSYCDDFSGENGSLEITSFEITNNGAGDDTEWEYLDEIEIEVTVENTGSSNINDILVELRITDDNNNTITKRKIGLNKDEVDLGRINDGDEETAVFKISELPVDLDNGEYRIYVRAYDEKNKGFECASTSDDFTNSDETYFGFEIIPSDGATVIVKNDLENVLASCGDKNVEVKFMVYNTGNNDEDKVLVTLENSKLGINEKTVINDLRDKKGKEATFFISVPEEVKKTLNELKIYTYYDYDKDEDELDELVAYGDSSEEEGDDFSVLLEILSCKSVAPTLSANLDSVAEVGAELVVKTIITNNGEDNDFVISASDFGTWAELVSVTPQTASIKRGEYAEVIITLRPTTTGTQSFNINTIVDGESYKQSVSVKINDNKEPGLFSGKFDEVSSVTLYAIVGIIVLLVVIFLVAILKAFSKPVKPQF